MVENSAHSPTAAVPAGRQYVPGGGKVDRYPDTDTLQFKADIADAAGYTWSGLRISATFFVRGGSVGALTFKMKKTPSLGECLRWLTATKPGGVTLELNLNGYREWDLMNDDETDCVSATRVYRYGDPRETFPGRVYLIKELALTPTVYMKQNN